MVAVYLCRSCPCRIVVFIFPATRDDMGVVIGYHFPAENGRWTDEGE